MFKSATSYLWGSSNTKQPDDSLSTAPNYASPRHKATASLPDLHELHLEEKECLHHSISNSPSSNHSNPITYYSKPLYSPSPPVDIILDIESKYKLSATSSIAFLFTNKSHNHTTIIPRCPYFIVSNRNARYFTKVDKFDIEHMNDRKEQQLIEYDTGSPTVAADNHPDTNNSKTTTHPALDVSPSCSSSAINVKDLNDYLDSLKITTEEKKGILTLCERVKTEKLSIKLCHDMLMSEIIISYFSSLSPTNPDLFGCWKKWIIYRSDHDLYNVNCAKLKAFFDTGIFSVGFDHERRPVWFINTENYDDSFGVEIITKASVLWISSLLWNLNKNEFDLFALRRGISVYVNLSHWSINMASWTVLQALKKAMVAFPFHLVHIYVVNIPTFMYLIKQLATKVMLPHAMEKLKILTDTNEYFEKHAPKYKTPICAGGTLKVSPTQWIKDRGFLDYVDVSKKHHKAPSAPNLSHVLYT